MTTHEYLMTHENLVRFRSIYHPMLRKAKFAITDKTEHPYHCNRVKSFQSINENYDRIQSSLRITLGGQTQASSKRVSKQHQKLPKMMINKLKSFKGKSIVSSSPHNWQLECASLTTTSCIDLIEEISECLGSSSPNDVQESNTYPSNTSPFFVENVSI